MDKYSYTNYTGYDIYLPEGKFKLAPLNYDGMQKVYKLLKGRYIHKEGYWFALPALSGKPRYINEHDVPAWCEAYGYEYDSYAAKIMNRKYAMGNM